jgi:hypothetical protein
MGGFVLPTLVSVVPVDSVPCTMASLGFCVVAGSGR